MSHFVHSGSLTSFAEVVRDAGLDPGRLLDEFGLPRAGLDEPDLMIPVDAVALMLEASAQRCGDESLGLKIAEARKVSSLGPLGMFAREQPTLRDAITALSDYARLINEALVITAEQDADVAIVRVELLVGDVGPIRQAMELAVGVVLKTMRTFLGAEWKPRRTCFVHGAPHEGTVHARFLGRDVVFGQDFNGLVCTRRDLDVVNPDADPTMARYARQLLETWRSQGHESFVDSVRQLVVMQLGSGGCTVERIAHLLRVDRRTIHRRLAQEQQTFSGLVDAVRRELASRYLADRKRTLAEISGLLGFAAPSGFSRWYRQQFGTTASGARDERIT
jgi:AraC-like DNA-binding protein